MDQQNTHAEQCPLLSLCILLQIVAVDSAFLYMYKRAPTLGMWDSHLHMLDDFESLLFLLQANL